MSIEKELLDRSGGQCELCSSEEGLSVLGVYPSDGTAERSILVCSTCKEQIEGDAEIDENHWKCLHDSMWSEVPAVVVSAYRLLKKLGWQEQLDMLYLEDDIKEWAEDMPKENSSIVVRDSNGTQLHHGDSVTIIKDLEVKGAGFTAKRGTIVKNISLTDDVEGHIEGRVNGTKIYLKTEFLKKV
jgi:protein PhnA